MELVKVNKKEMEAILASVKNKPGRLQKVIEDFVCSGEKVAKLSFDADGYKSVRSMFASMFMACRRSRHRVHAKLFEGQVYLVRDED